MWFVALFEGESVQAGAFTSEDQARAQAEVWIHQHPHATVIEYGPGGLSRRRNGVLIDV